MRQYAVHVKGFLEEPAILIMAISPFRRRGLPVDFARIEPKRRGVVRLTVKSDAIMRIAVEERVAASREKTSHNDLLSGWSALEFQ